MMLVIVVLILTPTEAIIAVGGYLLLGAIGLPVFSGFRGGFGVLLGPTGGFLTGFFAAAIVVGLLRTLFGRRLPTLYASAAFDVLLIVVITLIYYVAGTWWFVFSTGATVYAALAACVLPFLATGVLKSVAAFICVQPIRVALGRATWSYRSKAGDNSLSS
jgi:biotin transport system substrate-specific component